MWHMEEQTRMTRSVVTKSSNCSFVKPNIFMQYIFRENELSNDPAVLIETFNSIYYEIIMM